MACLSKAHSFPIYEDAGTPTPDSGYCDPFDDTHAHEKDGEEVHLDRDDAPTEEARILQRLDEDERDESAEGMDNECRRASTITRTSVSSVPDPTWQDEKPYVPPLIRPSFMRPESVRRMQMSSPPLYRSPRQSLLRHARSRTGMPHSLRSAQARGSPRPRRQVSEETEHETMMGKEYPLVLLHVTLLPIVLPWSAEAVQESLPASVLGSLQLLRSKLTDTILARGLLLPHPREEYELLEERLLEALELKEERVTKCGHFRGNHASTSAVSSTEDSDSSLGSRVEGSVADGDVCATCSHPIKSSASGAGIGDRNWSIKVYAANGLMRAPAWAAAWNEMESVDVEILPWIDETARMKLNARSEQEAAEEKRRQDAEEERWRQIEEHRLAVAERTAPAIRSQEGPDRVGAEVSGRSDLASSASRSYEASKVPTSDLPQVYRPSQIPLSVLLKNYVFLLAQDRRNVAIFFVSLLALLSAMGMSASTTTTAAVGESLPFNQTRIGYEAVSSLLVLQPNVSAERHDTNPAVVGMSAGSALATASDVETEIS